jgi:hypothetical protein
MRIAERILARPASHVGVTIRLASPSFGRTTAAGPNDLNRLSTNTGFGVSMKCAPSWMATS